MEWSKLLSPDKLVEETPLSEKFADYPINVFEKDFHKIVCSAAFRRLQDKTQVYPLDKSDFVRTRLTHSIEVSTVARQLGIMLCKNTSRFRCADMNPEMGEDIPSILACAGLLHDLGNPPFGHFGETTIGLWFSQNLDTVQYKGAPLRSYLSAFMCADLENFEGNAQALRLMCKAQHGAAMNLSYSVMSTLIKYPTSSLNFDHDHPDIKKHKLGYFTSETREFYHIAATLGTLKSDGTVCRHPLAYLLEAADDIAYTTADLEDGFKKKMFSLDALSRFLRSRCEGCDEGETKYLVRMLDELDELRNSGDDTAAFCTWLDHFKQWLMYVVIYRFIRSYDEIMEGTYPDDLFAGTNQEFGLAALKSAMPNFVYDSKENVSLELSCEPVLHLLLNKFIQAILYSDKDYCDSDHKPSQADKKILVLLSENYKADYEKSKTGDENYDLYLRILIATDCISGMTDTYARRLYRELCGIE